VTRNRRAKFDVVVAGAGGSGIAAALTLAEGNANVMVFEKMRYGGGSTRFPEGMFAVGSEMQRKRNIRITRDDAFRDIMNYSHWKANAALVRAFVDKSASTIDWLEQMGVGFIEPSSFWPGAPRTWHLFKGYGATMMKVLLARAADKGVEVRYQTRVKQLVREGSGPVTGVIVEDSEGRETKVAATAVIIATGGYANDKELLKQYTGLDLRINLFPLGNSEKYGEGIRMAWQAGAAAEGMGVLNFSFGGPVGPGIKPSGHIVAAVRQPELWINQHGVRFCDESIVHNSIF
jgi:fumarate reductase flavoprotein subunit